MLEQGELLLQELLHIMNDACHQTGHTRLRASLQFSDHELTPDKARHAEAKADAHQDRWQRMTANDRTEVLTDAFEPLLLQVAAAALQRLRHRGGGRAHHALVRPALANRVAE